MGDDDEGLSEESTNALRQDIGFVFQGFSLWEERTVSETWYLPRFWWCSSSPAK